MMSESGGPRRSQQGRPRQLHEDVLQARLDRPQRIQARRLPERKEVEEEESLLRSDAEERPKMEEAQEKLMKMGLVDRKKGVAPGWAEGVVLRQCRTSDRDRNRQIANPLAK